MAHPLKFVARAALVGLLASWSPAAHTQSAPAWPDTFLTRVQALALIQTLNAELLASRSATVVLEKWCRDHQLAGDARISAQRVAGAAKTADAEQRQRLQITSEAVKYRRVRLRCGDHVLSEADNWYVPSRLTAEMNRALDTTDTPFGIAVRALAPYRQTFSVTQLWSPLPPGWEGTAQTQAPCATAGALSIPDALFEHRAVLYTRDHLPFSEVREVYQRQVLAFPAPGPCR